MNVYEVMCFDVNTNEELIDPVHIMADSLSDAFDLIQPTLQYLYIEHDYNPHLIRTINLDGNSMEVADDYYLFKVHQVRGIRALLLPFIHKFRSIRL